MDMREHLKSTRQALTDIARYTASLGDDPALDEIESVLKRRDVIICRMKTSAAQLEGVSPGWNNASSFDGASRTLLEENASLLRLVAEMDNRLARLLETKKAGIKTQLSFAYSASRATSAYIVHNVFRAAV
jgi:hypothetical protein